MEYTDVLINIRKIVRSLNLESKRIQKEFGISIPQLLCLDYLATQPNFQSTTTAIANYLNLNLSTVTGIVGRLEKKHYVAKLPKSGDKRVSYIVLTATGSRQLSNSPELMHQQLSRKLSSIPDEQLIALKASLRLLVEVFRLEDQQASPMITIDDFQLPPEDLV